jgi:hypothetical protein
MRPVWGCPTVMGFRWDSGTMLNSSSDRSVPLIGTRIGISKDIRGLLTKKDNPQKTFRLRFNARSSLVAILGNTRFNTNVNLELLDSTQTRVIAASRRLANRPERIELKQLAPDTYYLRAVLAHGKQSRFRLRANTTPIPDTGNSPSTARFSDLTAPVSFSEFVGAEDFSDFYSFTVGSRDFPTGQLKLNLTGANGDFLEGNVTVKIRDSALNVVTQQTTSGRIGFSLEEPLAAGNYFLQVEPTRSEDQINYRLDLSATAIADSAGNTPNAARSIDVTAEPSLVQDFVGIGDQQDYYRFTVPDSKFDLKLTGPNGNLLGGEITLRLRDDVNTVLEQKSTNGGAGLEFNDKTLKAGTYIVQVSTSAKFVNYQLVVSAQPDEVE